MNMVVVFPDYDSAVELIKHLIARGTVPQKITAIGRIMPTDSPNRLAELLDGFGTLTLPDNQNLLVAGAWAPRVSVISSDRLDGLFVEFGLPFPELLRIEEMVKAGHYLVAVEDETENPVQSWQGEVLWAWPVDANLRCQI